MKTITIANFKGGVGKTTTTVNLAYSLAGLNQRVLVIDMDPQSNTTAFFGRVNETSKTVQTVLEKPKNINSCIYRTKYKNVDIIKGCFRGREVEDHHMLQTALSFLKKSYDYILIDTRPAFEGLTLNALQVSDLMLTPVRFDNYSRDNLVMVEDLYHELKSENNNLDWKVFATCVANGRAQRTVSEDLLTRHDYPFLDTCVSRSADVDNALCLYKPVSKHHKKSAVAADYMDLAKEIMEL